MMNFDNVKNELRDIVTKETVFVCIGTPRCKFDAFGPLVGNELRDRGIPYYGDCNYGVNGVTMYDRLEEIYEYDKVENKNIIAIDAAVTVDDEMVNQVIVRDRGIRPGSGVGKKFPTVGENAIMMFTLTKAQVPNVMRGYQRNDFVGRQNDICDYRLIKEYAKTIADVIEEVYNEVLNAIEI